MDCCMEHSGHASRIKSNEEGLNRVAHTTDAAHRRIDSMKNWVIAGMTSLVLQLIVMISGLVLLWTRTGHGG